MPSTLVPVPIPTGGVRPDLLPEQVPPDSLVDSQNWIFRDGAMRVRNGLQTLASTVSARPTGYISYKHNDSAQRLVKATVAKWWQFVGSAWVDITGTGLTGAATDQQVFRVFDKAGVKYLLGTNGANTMKKWDGTAATYSDVAGTPPRARCMMIINDHVMLLNLLTSFGTAVAGGSSYDFSADIDFDSGWGATLSGILADTPGEIVSANEMGSLRGAIYKTDAVHVATASGGIAPVSIELVQAGIEGPVSPLSVAKLSDGLHVFLAQDGSLQQFDGVNVNSIEYQLGRRAIQKYITNSWDLSAREKSFLVWDAPRKELHVVYIENGSTEPNIDLMVSFPSLSIYPQRFATVRPTAGGVLYVSVGTTIGEMSGAIGDQTKTLGQYETINRRLLLGDVTGQSFYESGATDNGSAIANYFETGLTDFGDPATWKTMGETDQLFSPTPSTQPVTVRLGSADYGESRVLDVGQALDLLTPNGQFLTGHRSTGRRFSMRLESSASQPVVWHGASASVVRRGRR